MMVEYNSDHVDQLIKKKDQLEALMDKNKPLDGEGYSETSNHKPT